MKITQHKLVGANCSHKLSPNHGANFAAARPDTIVIHYTAGPTLSSAVDSFLNPERKASAHLVVSRDPEDGAAVKIVQMVPFDTVAWHAGPSKWKSRTGLNKFAIGIEIVNAGLLVRAGEKFQAWFGRLYPVSEVIEAVHRNETTPRFWHRYTEKQISTVFDLCDLLIQTYPITTIVGHEEISPGRKVDPGPAFPLDKLRERLIIRNRGENR